MITKIVLENFMAHERTELELGPGVNALTGPNNTGKSAIVEALRCVATNPLPKHYIRHGAKEARVSVELENGTKVVWVRKKRSSGYELWAPGAEEPEEYWKFGRKPPEDVQAALKLDLVELETGNEVDVHVGNQREPVFLLNQPPSNAAAFFAASTESAHLLAMQNLLKRRTQDAKRTERGLEARLGGIEGEMDAFSSLPDIALQVETACEQEKTAKQLQSEIPALDAVLVTQRNLTHALALSTGTATVLNAAESVPNLSPISGLSEIIQRVVSVEYGIRKAEKAGSVLATLQATPVVDDTAELATVCRQLQQVEVALRKAKERAGVSAALTEPPAPQDTVHLSELIDQMIVIRHRKGRIARWGDALQTIVEPPEIRLDVRLEGLLADIRGLIARKSSVEAAMADLENQLQSLKERIVQRVEEVGCCPTCGADINTEAFLDRRCRHDS